METNLVDAGIDARLRTSVSESRRTIGAQPRRVSPLGTRTTVTAVIPAKNEAGNIAWVLSRLPAYVEEVILVDGWSTDDTIAVAKATRPDIIVVTQSRPGKGTALRAGFERATGELVVMLDADGSMEPSEIGRYLFLLQDGFDLVKGSRFMSGGNSTDITFVRKLGNRCLLSLVNRMYDAPFTDLCYGYCAFHRRHVATLALTAEGFEVETEIVVRAARAGLRIAEVPSAEAERLTGTSNLNVVRDGTRVLRTIFAERLRSAKTGDDGLGQIVPDPGRFPLPLGV